ncbi:MAG: SDR family oxidoreductase [Pseudomonadota bacterium]
MSTVAVIGAAGGIGRVLVAELIAAGETVLALDLPASLERHPLPCEAIPIDLRDEASIAEAAARVEAMGAPLDGLVNLAGYTLGVMPLTETPVETFDDVLAGNLRGTLLSTRALMPLMADGGSVVTTASGLAQFVRPGHGAYAMAKAGLIAMTKTLALEEAPRLRVNAVAPGPVRTAFLTGGTGRSDERGESLVSPEQMAALTPLKRLAEPEDVTGPIRFLLGPDSRFLTGQVLWINGGAYMP